MKCIDSGKSIKIEIEPYAVTISDNQGSSSYSRTDSAINTDGEGAFLFDSGSLVVAKRGFDSYRGELVIGDTTIYNLYCTYSPE